MWETGSGQWEAYSPDVSRDLELARRAGAVEHSLRVDDLNVVCKVNGGGGGGMTQECGGESQRLRRRAVSAAKRGAHLHDVGRVAEVGPPAELLARGRALGQRAREDGEGALLLLEQESRRALQ
jgi:hypothetical protein